MYQRWIGPIAVLLILGGVVSVLVLNLNFKGINPHAPVSPDDASGADSSPPPRAATPATSTPRPASFREYPIGDEVERNQMRIAAVWLPPVQMEGMPGPASSDLIHIEADIHATEGNPNGFAKDEFVPYLEIHYTITAADGGKVIDQGPLMPMVARDGPHYGASLTLPKAGAYRLTYAIEPPSAGGLGRHSDPVTGVAPWWEPFEVTFDWDFPGPPK